MSGLFLDWRASLVGFLVLSFFFYCFFAFLLFFLLPFFILSFLLFPFSFLHFFSSFCFISVFSRLAIFWCVICVRTERINPSLFILSTPHLCSSYPCFLEFWVVSSWRCSYRTVFVLYIGSVRGLRWYVYVRVSVCVYRSVCGARCFTVQSRLWCLYSKLLWSSKGCPQQIESI